jgi:hypothetical protein
MTSGVRVGILMMTPSGRFETNRRLCLSMSDCAFRMPAGMLCVAFGFGSARTSDSLWLCMDQRFRRSSRDLESDVERGQHSHRFVDVPAHLLLSALQ